MGKQNSEFKIGKNRLEAFSDGVIAFIITIMVLELKTPHSAELSELLKLFPVFACYILSFIYVAIYWNNHHHMLAGSGSVNGKIMWANMALLFWLSLVPFATAYMGENHFEKLPTAIYGFVLFMCGITYIILSNFLIAHSGSDSPIAIAAKDNNKGVWSLLLYGVAIPLSFIQPYISFAIYIMVATLWFIPSKMIESLLNESN